jgi:poly-gamma-glutamate capsule biosynthesis protein CapA/YwtB (metallophosphatase superfamily)
LVSLKTLIRLKWPLCVVMLFFVQSPINHAQDDVSFWADLFVYYDPETVLTDRQPDDIVIMATGDVLLARSINARMLTSQNFTFPFEDVSGLLSQADATWVNLETPLIADCPIKYTGMTFCGDPQTIAGLQFAGIDVVNLANNHAENQGEAGVIETEQHLNAAGIEVTGLARPVILDIQGRRVGFLGFSDVETPLWISDANPDEVVAQIKSLRGQVDYLLVGFHWGYEYHLKQDDRQRVLGQLAIDSGADVVIGHHPHWVQGVEIYHGKPILYSLGNFVFDQNFGGWVEEGAIAIITFEADGDLQIKLIPIVIEELSTPRFPPQWRAKKILQRMASVSAILDD